MTAGEPSGAVRAASCSCGALRATVVGDPVRVSVCHCLACQRRTGSPFGEQARFASTAVELSGAFTEYVRHADEDDEARTYRFCPVCGATVVYAFENSPELVVIPAGAFADPGFPPPTRAIYDDRRHPWVTMPDTITDFA